MNQHSFTILVLITISLLNGCSLFTKKAPNHVPEQSNHSVPVPNKVLNQSCEVECSKRGGIKKKICINNCHLKQVRGERKKLNESCNAGQESWWFRFTYIIKDIFGYRCDAR